MDIYKTKTLQVGQVIQTLRFQQAILNDDS